MRRTKKERREKLKRGISPEYLFNNTSIFMDPIGDKPLDPYTVERIKYSYKLYFDSWIRDEAEELIK